MTINFLKIVFRKFQCILFLKISFDDALFFNFNNIIPYFLSLHFISFYMHEKLSVIISKAHYKSIFSRIHL